MKEKSGNGSLPSQSGLKKETDSGGGGGCGAIGNRDLTEKGEDELREERREEMRCGAKAQQNIPRR